MEAGFARVLRIARATGLAGIEESISYGTPSLKLAGKFLARMKDDDTLVVKCPIPEKEMLMAAAPEVFFQTDHYVGYDSFLVRLSAAEDADIAGRLQAAWGMQAPKKFRK